jgi:hypothetical protein
MTDMEIGSVGVVGRGEEGEDYTSRDLNHQTSGCSAIGGQQQQQQQPGPSAPHHIRQQGGSNTLTEHNY